MINGRWYLTASLALVASGATLIGTHFDVMSPWLYIGLTMTIASGQGFIAWVQCNTSRSMDEEFEAGYRMGYKAGRRVPVIGPVASLGQRREVKRGRVQAVTLRSVAGDGQAARWSASDAN